MCGTKATLNEINAAAASPPASNSPPPMSTTPDTTPETFKAQLSALTAQIAGKALDSSLDAWLNREHGPGSPTFAGLKAACQAGVAAGWLCEREGGGIRYVRIFKPAAELHGFSVDVVDMRDSHFNTGSP